MKAMAVRFCHWVPNKGKKMHWSIVTPEYGTVIPILDDGTGPMEYGADVVYVVADNKRQALVEGVRALRKMGSEWMLDQQSDNASPFTGLKAYEAECEHGFCYCELRECPNYENDICPECEEESKQNCVHEMYIGRAQLSGQRQAELQEYCNFCMQTREEIDARSNQKFATTSDIYS